MWKGTRTLEDKKMLKKETIKYMLEIVTKEIESLRFFGYQDNDPEIVKLIMAKEELENCSVLELDPLFI